MDKTYEDIKRTFNSTRKTINIGYLMNEFSLGFFEVTDYLKQLMSDGVIREVEGGYAKIPPEERPSIKKVDAILAKLDADTAEYCKLIVDGDTAEDCNELLSITEKSLYQFESRLERAGFLVRRLDGDAKPMISLDQDEYAYFKKKIAKTATDLRMEEDLDSIRTRPSMRRWMFKTQPRDRKEESRKDEATRIYANAVYGRLIKRLRSKVGVTVNDDEWSYDAEYKGVMRTYKMQISRRGASSGGIVCIEDIGAYEHIKRVPYAAEKYRLDKILAQYRASVVNEGGIKGMGCKFDQGEDEFDAICRLASCLDALYAIKEVLL